MKTIATLILTLLSGTCMALAHQMEGGNKEGLFGLKPEYIHVLLNPLPGYGLGIGVAILAVGLLARNRTTLTIGLIVTCICAASAWPVLLFGQRGYNDLYPLLDTESQQWLNVHMNRGERFIYFFYATALLAIAALALARKFPKPATKLAILTLASGVASLGIGMWIARPGGEVSHSEFRTSEPPNTAPAHQHQNGSPDESHGKMPMSESNSAHKHDSAVGETTNAPAHQHQPGSSEKSHEKMPATNTSNVHQHPATAEPSHDTEHKHAASGDSSGKGIRMPDTLEGIWREIHRHHGVLEFTVKDRKFSDVQSHAKELSALAKKLVEIAHPDHKPAVESGVTKIHHALDELKSSAETGSDVVMKKNLKEFEEVLQQLEQQMKKQ